MANLFSSSVGPVSGTSRARTRDLLDFYVGWGPSKHVLIPRDGDAKSERAHQEARYLAPKRQLRFVSASTRPDDCLAHPSAELVLGQAAPQWAEADRIEVWELTPRFAAFLDRLALGASGAGVTKILG